MAKKILSIPQHKNVASTPDTPESGYNKIYVKSDGCWYSLDDVGNETLISGGGGVITTTLSTYQQLYNLVVSEQLVPGTIYKFPYRSVNFLNGWNLANQNPTPIDPSFDPREVYVGEEEMLYVQAISNSELSPTAYSEKFPNDIIQFAPYTNKIGVDIGGISNGSTLPDSSTVSGFDLQWDGTNVYFNMPAGYPALYGHYFYVYCQFDDGVNPDYVQDGAFEPLTPNGICQYPYSSDDPIFNYPKKMSRIRLENNGQKVILVDLVQADFTNYVADTLYVDAVYAIDDAYGWITKRVDTDRNISVPFDFRGRIYRRYEVDFSAINASLGTNYYGQGDNYFGQGTTGNYIDVPSFGRDGYDTFDIDWNDIGGPDSYWYAGYNDNNVFLHIFHNCKIKSDFRNNSVIDSFNSNDIGHNFNNNTITSFQSNIINDGFRSNTIGDYFQTNTIMNFFQSNNIGSYFYENYIGSSVFNNNIGDGFISNFIANGFAQNTIGSGFTLNNVKASVSSTNFTSGPSTHVYGNYNCEIFRRSDVSLQLSYIDGTNTIQYTAITA